MEGVMDRLVIHSRCNKQKGQQGENALTALKPIIVVLVFD